MWKIITGLMILHLILSFIDGIIVGTADYYTTKLTSGMTSIATTANVANTSGWKVTGTFWINDEKISYNGKTSTSFLNLVRGYGVTDASTHVSGTRVYSVLSDATRTSVGYNVADLGTNVGGVNMLIIPVRFAMTALPSLLTCNYSFLKEGNAQYIRFILVAFSAGFSIWIMLQIANGLAGVAQGFLRH